MIKLKKDEFKKIRDFIGKALDLTSKPIHKKLMNKNFGVSWNKMNDIYEDLITSQTMELKRVKELKKFLKNVLKELEACEETAKNTYRDFNITITQIQSALKKLDSKKTLN